ncbi:hypothetical protein MMC28_011238 [Mycoblastus sanguinarius]|nr:hypothetical protein [Mycoblastus sanguinarius]
MHVSVLLTLTAIWAGTIIAKPLPQGHPLFSIVSPLNATTTADKAASLPSVMATSSKPGVTTYSAKNPVFENITIYPTCVNLPHLSPSIITPTKAVSTAHPEGSPTSQPIANLTSFSTHNNKTPHPTAASSGKTAAPTASATDSSCTGFYTVQSGDICKSIARANNITVSTFESMNPAINTDCTNLMPGDRLCVQSSLSTNTTAAAGNATNGSLKRNSHRRQNLDTLKSSWYRAGNEMYGASTNGGSEVWKQLGEELFGQSTTSGGSN